MIIHQIQLYTALALCFLGTFARETFCASLSVEGTQVAGDLKIGVVLKKNVGDTKRQYAEYNFTNQADGIWDWQLIGYTSCAGRAVTVMPFYVITAAEAAQPNIVGSWNGAEAPLIQKAANFWNNSGANLFLKNDGAWSSSYHQIYSPDGYKFDLYAIHKIIAPIQITGTRVFPWYPTLFGDCERIVVATDHSTYQRRDWEIFINGIEDGNVISALDPNDFNEAANSNYHSNAPIQYSLTKVVAHELGHALGLLHDQTIYNTRDLAGYNFVSAFDKAHSSQFEVFLDGRGCDAVAFHEKKAMSIYRPDILHKSGSNITRARWSDVAVHNPVITASGSCPGYAADSKILGGYVWEPYTGTLNDADTFFWHLSIMSTGATDQVTIDDQILNTVESYQLFGSTNLLLPASCGTSPASNRNVSPAYKQLQAVYGFNPSTPGNNDQEVSK